MPAVTIDKIDTFQLRIPLDTWAPPPMFAGRPRTHVEMFLVRVTCSNGDRRLGRMLRQQPAAAERARSTPGSGTSPSARTRPTRS